MMESYVTLLLSRWLYKPCRSRFCVVLPASPSRCCPSSLRLCLPQCCSEHADAANTSEEEHAETGLHQGERSESGAGEDADREEAAAPAFGGLLREDAEEAGGELLVTDGPMTKKEKERGARPAASKADKGGGKWKSLDLGKKGAQIRAGLASEILSEIEEEVRVQRAAQAVAARAVEWEDSLDAVLEPVLAIPGAPSAAGLAAALLATVLLADAHAWRFIRRPLPFNFLLTPFLTAAVLAGVAGFVALPLLRKLKARQVRPSLNLHTHTGSD